MTSSRVPVLIPSYKPSGLLELLVQDLVDRELSSVIVVDDGSGRDFDEVFQRLAQHPRVHVIRHAVNLGKGAALKSGMNYALVALPNCLGIVTADGDGQHHPDDIVRIAHHLSRDSSALIMGVRSFQGSVPWRSRIGNDLSRVFMRVLVGYKLTDTQTGLRGIPVELIPHLLRMQSTGYEFELDMLLACKHQGCPVREVTVRTIYIDDNKSSHFRPVFDSMRIYFLLLRFSMLSLLTAVLDNVVFAFIYSRSGSITKSQVSARIVAMCFNYLGARRAVFHSQQRHTVVLPKYIALVSVNGLVSYALIQFVHLNFGVNAISAKLGVEAVLFIANFAIMRDLVFTRREIVERATDWDHYYQHVVPTAKLTRRYTTSNIVSTVKRYASPSNGSAGLSILEIGGANSCFLEKLLASVECQSYDVVDTNKYGLSLLQRRIGQNSTVHLHQQSVLNLSLSTQVDIVFSVGLVEHFDVPRTRQAVLAHFDVLRPGGLAIITFPTPTWLYRITRSLAEALGIWQFPDERPIKPREILPVVQKRGEVLLIKTLWPLILTQTFLAVRKHSIDID